MLLSENNYGCIHNACRSFVQGKIPESEIRAPYSVHHLSLDWRKSNKCSERKKILETKDILRYTIIFNFKLFNFQSINFIFLYLVNYFRILNQFS